ncbi:MAG: hypothetical protein ACW98K_19220 [Candidatus Kariarchaeaceae archaeon]|jgi:hypothetical protein
MSRPKQAIKRQSYIKVSYTMAEYKFIEKLADKHGFSKVEFVRNKRFNRQMKPSMNPE